MNIFGKSEKGPVRLTNEDAFRISEMINNAYFALVCDGMGGENGGEVASLLAANKIIDSVRENYRENMSANSIRDMLITAVTSANALVHMKAEEDIGLHRMGTTVVAFLVVDEIAHIVNVGDSRAYLIKDNQIIQITKDHTMVQIYLEQGKITETEALNHPQKHVITRALGAESIIDIDYCEVILHSSSNILICSDGLTNYVKESQILGIIQENDVEDAVHLLVDTALSNGSTDNITVVLGKII